MQMDDVYTASVPENAARGTELTKAWGEFLRALEPYIKICGENMIKSISKLVMSRILSYVNSENPFTMNDERIFGLYDGLMAEYARTISVYSENMADISSLKISEILNGISEILLAQLKQYEEHMSTVNITCDYLNPITAEKERILKEVYALVMDALEVAADNIRPGGWYFDNNEMRLYCAECADKSVNESHIDFFTFIYERTIEKGGLDIYKSYSGAIMECAGKINSLDYRKEARYFYEAFKQEKENLESIVKIQVSALAGELEANDGTGAEERRTVERIIASLREMLERIQADTAELDVIFGASGAVKKPMLMNYDGFLSFIEENGLCAYTDKLRREGLETGVLSSVQLWKERLDAFMKEFSDYIDTSAETTLDQRPYKRFLFEARVKITDKVFLADGVIEGFGEMVEYYRENADKMKESVPEEYMRIIDGIHESIVIKIDSLMESKTMFEKETNERLERFTPPELTEEDERSLSKQKYSVWCEEMAGLDAFSGDYLQEAGDRLTYVSRRLSEIYSIESYEAKLEKKLSRESDQISKAETSFLKNFLLFEIITFEEILTYSVSKLRECTNEYAAEYARRCGELETRLIKLCRLHKIFIITPKPFDLFDSTEHEILVAEKNDAYKKGQIIKLMNSGFKYNEAILVRANVIAAK